MPSPYQFTPCGTAGGQCNCDGPCLIGTDTFTRGDSDSLGADWSERSGDADIVSNQLKFITAGLVRYETAHPDGTSGAQHVDVDFILDSTSDYARVVVCMSADDTYLYAGVEQVDGCWVLRLRQVSGGSDGGLGTLDLPVFIAIQTTRNLKVCWDPTTGILRAKLDDAWATQNVNGVTIADGSKVGLAGSASTIFDDFEFWILKDATHANCPDCQSPCFIGSDIFDRTDSTDLGCFWEEVVGTWEIVNNKLSQTTVHSGGSFSIAKYKVFHPTLDLNQYVEVDITLPDQFGMTVQNGARVLVNYKDSTNYHWAQLKINEAGDEVQLSIGKNGTTLDSAVQAVTPSGAITLRLTVCWDDDNQILSAYAIVGNDALGASAASTRVVEGWFVALYGDGDASELFDNFEFWKHKSEEEPDCPDCPEFPTQPPCQCTNCDDELGPSIFVVKVEGFDDCDPCLGTDSINGTYALGSCASQLLGCSPAGNPPNSCVWNSVHGCFMQPATTEFWEVRLLIGSDGVLRVIVCFDGTVWWTFDTDLGTAPLNCSAIDGEVISLTSTSDEDVCPTGTKQVTVWAA